MNSFAFVLVVVQAVLIQNAYSQVIRTAGPCGCSSNLISGPVLTSNMISSPVLTSPVVTTVAQPSVAASLADTLSLLTVSSLLAESLPLNPNVVAAVPVPVSVGPAYAPAVAYGGCGCGCGSGYNGLGYSYIF